MSDPIQYCATERERILFNKGVEYLNFLEAIGRHCPTCGARKILNRIMRKWTSEEASLAANVRERHSHGTVTKCRLCGDDIHLHANSVKRFIARICQECDRR